MLELEETLPVQLFASIFSICRWPRAAKSYFRSIYLSKTEQNESWALLLALLVHGPQMRMCVWVDGMNLKYALYWHICISVHSVPCQCYTQKHMHTCIPKPFEDSRSMGLKVDIAKNWTICKLLLRLAEKSRILPNILHDKSEGLRM